MDDKPDNIGKPYPAVDKPMEWPPPADEPKEERSHPGARKDDDGADAEKHPKP